MCVLGDVLLLSGVGPLARALLSMRLRPHRVFQVKELINKK